MKVIRLITKSYSDADYVDGVYRRKPSIENALYKHCKEYFDEKYRAMFIVEDEYKEEIFHESFVTLWENIEHRRLYVEDGVLKGKGGEPFSGKLTTYFMSIARLKYLEWVRNRRNTLMPDDDDKVWKKIDKDSYKDYLYDEDDETIITIIADCISHMSERCNQIITMFYYERKTLDDMMLELPSFESKNALKTAKYKCMENLRKSAEEIHRRYINS